MSADLGVAEPDVVWAVARAFGSRDDAIAHQVDEAEEHQVDCDRRRRLTKQEIRDAMRAPYR